MTRPLDREEESELRLSLVCVLKDDSGQEETTVAVETEVIVEVGDEDDHGPRVVGEAEEMDGSSVIALWSADDQIKKVRRKAVANR